MRAIVSGLIPANRARCWLTMLQAFIDDSGSEPNDPLFVLGGLIATVDRWSDFTPEWNAALEKEPAIRYFKAAEAHSRFGEFKRGWTRPLIDQRAFELTEIAASYAQYRVHCLMRWSDFNEHLKEIGDGLIEPYNTSFRNPYMVCFFGIVMAINAYRRHHRIDPLCEYIFDDQGKVGEFASIIYSVINNGELKAHLGSLPQFKSDKLVLPLQAADLYAWNVHDFAVSPKDRQMHVKNALFKLPAIQLLLDGRFLAPMRQTLMESARRAPQCPLLFFACFSHTASQW